MPMDERIRNLMRERGHSHLMLTVDDPNLGEKLAGVMEVLVRDEDAIRDALYGVVARHLKLMAHMGVYFEKAVHDCYPEFPVRSGIHSWEEYLPPLSPLLQSLVESHEGVVAAGGAA